jgi:hypothetical protein
MIGRLPQGAPLRARDPGSRWAAGQQAAGGGKRTCVRKTGRAEARSVCLLLVGWGFLSYSRWLDKEPPGRYTETMDTKRCPRCNEDKPLSGFHKDRSKSSGRCAWCKACKMAIRDGFPSRSPERRTVSNRDYHARPDVGRRNSIRRLTKKFPQLSPDQALELVNRKSCELCGRPLQWRHPSADMRPQVDHCKRTGRIRGVLCRTCNMFLGVIEGPFRDPGDPNQYHVPDWKQYLATR